MKNLFIKNLYYILDKKGLFIGRMEKEIGVSAGYFSRLKKDNNSFSPSMDVLMKVSNYLNVSMDLLCFSDLTGVNLTDEEEEVLNFIKRLKELTISKKIIWIKTRLEEVSYLEDINFKEDENNMRCLYKEIHDNNGVYYVYESLFEEGNFNIYGDIFSFNFRNSKYFLTKIINTSNSMVVYELYLLDDGIRHRVSTSNTAYRTIFYNYLVDLYVNAGISNTAINLDKEVKENIKKFLKEENK